MTEADCRLHAPVALPPAAQPILILMQRVKSLSSMRIDCRGSTDN